MSQPPGSYYDPNPGNRRASQEFHDRSYLFDHGMSQPDMDRHAQMGDLHAQRMRQQQAEEVHIQDAARRGYYAASSPAGYATSYGAVWPQPGAYTSVSPTATPVAAVPTRSRTVMAVLICVVVLAVLGAIVSAAYQHFTREVTLAQMGIQDKSYVTWSEDPTATLLSHVVTFNIYTTNSSDEERKVRFCARKEPGTTDNCFTYKLKPHTTVKGVVSKTAQYAVDEQNTTGLNEKVVKVDGFKVRA
jgi:hypothetical protein